MSAESTLFALIQMDDSKIVSILRTAIKIYGRMLHAMANDIYNSCIEDYYNGYTPDFYTRHGNIEGWNLYRAEKNSLTGGRLLLDTDASKLLPYWGKNGSSKREDVLGSVLNGLRGGPGIEGWPMNWDTSYPNSYSSYSFWFSTGHTIEEIMQDFEDNILDDTEDVFWECVAQLI